MCVKIADHKCPKDGCNAQVPFNMLACRKHWFTVSEATRTMVWELWKINGLSEEYLEAREKAVSEMNSK